MHKEIGARLAARGLMGGALMGLANLVPGVSGGTMLLAAGVYPQCIDAVARITTLRPDRRSVGLLASVALSGGLIILLLAGTVKDLVLEHRWAMYSLFLGSTLGGVPALWNLIGRPDGRCGAGAVAGLSAMVVATLAPEAAAGPGDVHAPVLFFAGLGAFAAMILPGLSGGYILLVSGQYVPILGAVDGLRSAAFRVDGPTWPALLDSVRVLLPFGAGGLAALVGVSSLVGWLLRRQRSLMLGLLLGLLLGAVLGLWPFGTPESGIEYPAPAQATIALGLAAGGFAATAAVARLGGPTRPT